MSYDNCWVEIGEPICCADGGASGSGVFGGLTGDEYDDGNMTWEIGQIDGMNYLFHPCIDTESLVAGSVINYESVTVPRRSESGVVKVI